MGPGGRSQGILDMPLKGIVGSQLSSAHSLTCDHVCLCCHLSYMRLSVELNWYGHHAVRAKYTSYLYKAKCEVLHCSDEKLTSNIILHNIFKVPTFDCSPSHEVRCGIFHLEIMLDLRFQDWGCSTCFWNLEYYCSVVSFSFQFCQLCFMYFGVLLVSAWTFILHDVLIIFSLWSLRFYL